MVQIADITNGKVVLDEEKNPLWEGSGSFDTLISAINDNLKIQYDSGRLVGNDYALAYIKGIEVAVAQASDFALQVQLQNKQLELLEKDLAKKDAEKALLDEQLLALQSEIAIKEAQSAKDIELKNKDLILKEKAITEAQFNIDEMLPNEKQKLLKEIQYLQTQNDSLVAKDLRDETLHVEIVAKAHQDYLKSIEDTRTVTYNVDNILPKEKENIVAKTDLTNKQRDKVSEDILLAEHERTVSKPKEDLILDAQYLKLGREKDLLDKEIIAGDKKNTLLDKEIVAKGIEINQVMPAEILKTKNQANLYRRQTEGFDDDRDQRLVDTAKELWTIAYSSSPTDVVLTNAAGSSWVQPANNAFINLMDRATDILDKNADNTTRFDEENLPGDYTS